MSKIRTITQIMKLLKEQDPETAISERAIRMAVKKNEIPHIQVGNKVLLNFDDVCKYFLIKQKTEEKSIFVNNLLENYDGFAKKEYEQVLAMKTY